MVSSRVRLTSNVYLATPSLRSDLLHNLPAWGQLKHQPALSSPRGKAPCIYWSFGLLERDLMLLARHQTSCRRPFNSQDTPSPRRSTLSQSTRRGLLASLASAGLLLAQKSSAADVSSSTTPASEPGSFITIAPINNDAKEYMERRDDAMTYKCTGGMFDCDGDRRDFAKKQYREWLDAGGVPKRIRDGKPEGPRAF